MSGRLFDTLKQYWGYDSFRPLQQEAINCVLEHRDSVVVLPTGGGKSLCFQLPAMVLDGMAVVVSPLIALMKDQVDALRGMGIPAAAINSTLNAFERREIDEEIRAGRIKILYVTPERLVTDRFIEYLRNNRLSFVAVDEAHCISQWGHDFRPEFRGLGILRDAFPDKGIHAYTATATPQVRQDIASQLKLRAPVFHTGAFDRPNLHYRVSARQNVDTQVQEVLDRNVGESGVIYCIRRKEVDEMCASLKRKGHRALPYHAGMDNESRRRNQESFIRGDADIIVATVAFGMGIDKPDVRYVIHTGLPKSIEHYQQESGRAGRDGLSSECVLLYSKSDYVMWRGIAEKEGGEGSGMALRKAGEMLEYCTQPRCRHATLTSYFGERMRVETCVSCDVCTGEVPGLESAKEVTTQILRALQETGERFGGAYLSKILTGQRDERITANAHHRLVSFGALNGNQPRDVHDWIEQLAGQGYLQISGEYRVCQLAARGRAWLSGEEDNIPLLSGGSAPSRVRRTSKPALLATPEDRVLFDSLRALRQEIAHEEEVPPYIIFGDRTLVAMAVARPHTDEEFAQVHGVGSIKHERYGAQFIAHIRSWCEARGLGAGATQQQVVTASRRESKPMRMERAIPLFEAGMSIVEVAEELHRAPSTVLGYLLEAVEHGRITDLSPWVPDEDLKAVRQMIETRGPCRLSEIREALGNSLEYDVIKLILASFDAESRG